MIFFFTNLILPLSAYKIYAPLERIFAWLCMDKMNSEILAQHHIHNLHVSSDVVYVCTFFHILNSKISFLNFLDEDL